MGPLVVDYFTDPLSPWCWAAQPTVRRLAYEVPDLEIRPRMTVVFPTGEPAAEGAPYAAVARDSGMPVADGLWADGVPSSLLASAAVAAVRSLAPDRVDAYLRRLREAAFVDGDLLDDPDRLRAVAAETAGLEADAVAEALGSDRAAEALLEDLEFGRETAARLDDGSLEARGSVERLDAARRTAAVERLVPDATRPEDAGADTMVAPPTLRIETDDAAAVADLRIGYQRLVAALGGRAVPRDVSGLSDKFGTGRLAVHVPRPLAESLSTRDYVAEVRPFVHRFGRVYVAEVAAGTGRSVETCRAALEALEAQGEVERVDDAGEGWRMIEGAGPTTPSG